MLARRLAAGEWEIAWAQLPVTLEKSDFHGARAGWLAGWPDGWLMTGRELRKLSNQGCAAGQAGRPGVAPFLVVENEGNNGHVTKLRMSRSPAAKTQGGFVDGVKVKRVEERDSVLGSVGGARRTDPNPGRTSLALASGMGIGIWIAMALPLALPRAALLSSCSLLCTPYTTAAAQPVASDRHESMSWGRARQLQGCGRRAWMPWPARLRACPASTQLHILRPACHLTCWGPLNREWR